MLNAKHAKVLDNFGPDFNGCHPKASYVLQVSVPAAFSVWRPQPRGAAASRGRAESVGCWPPCMWGGCALTLAVTVTRFAHFLLEDLLL